jgi:hypothetical protein
MQTSKDLQQEFGTRFPTLDQVSQKYLGWGHEMISRKIASNDIPFDYFKMVKSNKAPWLVDVIKLAEYIDNVANK